MGGVKSLPTYDGKPVRLNPLPNLSETGNIVLRNGVLDSAQFESAGDFLEKLEGAEAEKVEVIKPPAQPEVSSIPAELPSVARSELRETESLNKGQLTEALTSSPSPGIEPLAATLSAPSQTPERQRGFGRMAAGLAVVMGFCGIAGFFILQSSRPAPKGNEVAQASPQITEERPAVITVPETAPSATPQTTPAPETATIRVPSGPPAETTPEAAQAAPTTASQGEPQTSPVAEPTTPAAPQFGDVLLTSDPPGAAIYRGSIKLGEAPLTISFPAESVELTSRFKMLAPVQQRFTADPKKNIVVEFKHEYGSVVVQSDQPDTSVVIDGTSLGKAPLTQLLAPGHHQVAAVASGRAAQTQEFNIEAKETKALHFDLARAVDPLTASPSPTPAATSSEGLPALLTAPGLKPEAEGSAPSTSQPGSTPSPTVRPPLQSESATERTGQNRSLSRQPRVFQPVPNQLRQQPQPAQSPIFLTRKNYSQAKREALQQFDAQWNAKRDDLKRQRDWLSYQINRSTGTAQEKFKVQMEQVESQIDQFDAQRRSARQVLRQSWEGLRTGQ
jgi:hypothetical protein